MNVDEWKNKRVFEDQLDRNLYELNDHYPEHWNILLDFLLELNEKEGCHREPSMRLYDIGCGCGALKKLLQRHYPNTLYAGFDFSEEAIALARSHWKDECFWVMDYNDLTTEICKDADIIHEAGLSVILPNGGECLKKLLSLDVPYVILQKLQLTDKPSYSEKYNAYNIPVYEYHQNKQDLEDYIFDSGYKKIEVVNSQVGTSLLLKKV